MMVDKGDRIATSQPVAVIADATLTYAVEKAQAELDREAGPRRGAEIVSGVGGVTTLASDSRMTERDSLDIAQRDEAPPATALRERQAGSTTDLDRASGPRAKLTTDDASNR